MKDQTIKLLEGIKKALEDNANAGFESAAAIEKLRDGDYYGDPLPDSIADIAKSLRILSGREELEK